MPTELELREFIDKKEFYIKTIIVEGKEFEVKKPILDLVGTDHMINIKGQLDTNIHKVIQYFADHGWT